MNAECQAETLIVGAGHAGVALAVALNKTIGHHSITVIGDEPQLPYERPALSKRLLYDPGPPSPVLLRSPMYWEKSPVNLRLDEQVVGIDPARKNVHTERGATLGYGRLVWAAGGRAARTGIPGEELAGVHTLRRFADLTALKADLANGRSAVVVGGGYLGLEAASGLRTLGLAVTVVEVAPRLLARVTGEVVSEYFTSLHSANGVRVRVGVGVGAIIGAKGRVEAVCLTDSTTLRADIVILGVGMSPVVEPLLQAGAKGDLSGIEVDRQCRTSLPDVFAIGDCARQINPYSPLPTTAVRIESVHNAAQHAAAVSHLLAHMAPPQPSPPRFWSTQYFDELKTVGLATAGDEQVVRGDPGHADFTVLYLRDGRLVALDTVNRPRDFARGQALVASGWRPPSGRAVSDPTTELPHV